MTTDPTPPIQPPDETPLAGVSPVSGVENGTPPPPPPWEGAAPAPAAVRSAIERATEIVMPALDGVYGAITDLVRNAADPLRRSVAQAERAVGRVIKAAEEKTAQTLLDLHAAGVPVSFSAPERVAELSDPSLSGILDRVERAITQPPAPPDDAGPAPPDPAQAGPAAPDPAGRAAPPPAVTTDRPPGFAPVPVPPPGTPCPTFPAVWDGSFSINGCAWWEWQPVIGSAGGDWVWTDPFSTGIAPGSPPARAGGAFGEMVVVGCTWCPPATPAPPAEPAPVPECDPLTWDVSGPDDDAILYAPGGPGETPLDPTDTLVVLASNGKCYKAEPATVPDPLPVNVRIVPDDQVPPGCVHVRGVRYDCPPKPEPKPEPEPVPVPPPVPSPGQTCPAPPPPPPPIVIPACPKDEEPDPPPMVSAPAGFGADTGTDPGDPAACRDFSVRARARLPAPPATLAAPGGTPGVPIYTPGVTGPGWTIVGATATLAPVVAGLELVSTHLASAVLDHGIGAALYGTAVGLIPTTAAPNWQPALGAAAKLGLARLAESRTGIPITYMFQSEQYFFQYANPQYVPGQAELDAYYLSNKISESDWECYTRMNGNKPELFRVGIGAKQNTINDSDVVQARMRGIIPSDAAFAARMRELGYLDPRRAAEKLALAKQIPGPADLVRMMVRDSADDRVAADYGYDTDFGAKFVGQVRDWAAAQGMDDNYFKYLWRAHWDIPSNTALYSMFHRLRPDRNDVRVWDNEASIRGVPATELALGPRPPVVTIDEVKRALQVNDTAPTWVDPLLAVSYHPITNTDARRAFQIGFITFDELVSRTRDNGYSPADAEMLARFFQAERERSITASTGVGSPRWVLAAYVEGLIDYAQADQQLREYFPDPIVRANQLRKADFKAQTETARAAVRTSVKRFVYGEIDENRLRADLGVVGVGGVGQSRIVSKAIASRDGHMKEPRVTSIIEMYVRSILSRDQAYDRMYRLGYSDEDINNMLRLGGAKEQERQAVRAASEANRRRLEAKRNAEGALRLLQEQAAAESRKLDAARRELAKIQKQIEESGCTPGGSPGE